MFLVGVLCLLAAATITVIVEAFPSMNPAVAFLTSWLALVFAAGGLQVKEKRLDKGPVGCGARFFAAFVVLATLSPAVQPYLALWRTHDGFWTKAFFGWLALITLMLVWVPLQGGEDEPRQPSV